MPRAEDNPLDGPQHAPRNGGATRTQKQQIVDLQSAKANLTSRLGALRELYNTSTHTIVELKTALATKSAQLKKAQTELKELRERAAQSIYLPDHLTYRRNMDSEVMPVYEIQMYAALGWL